MRSVLARRRLSHIALTALALGLAGSVAVSAPAAAAILIVTSSDDSGAGSLRAVLAAADANDTIVFDPSVTSIALLSTVDVTVGVTIDGPGSDALTISRANPGADFVMLSLEPGVPDQDFTIEGLHFDGAGGGEGSAIAARGFDELVRDVTVRDVRVTDNTAAFGAGVEIVVIDGDILVEDSTFTGNSAQFDGGALAFPNSAAVVVRDSVFRENSAGGEGGAVFMGFTREVTIEGSTFDQNSADLSGAVRIDRPGAPVRVSTSTFSFNWALNGDGGAVSLGEVVQTFDVEESTFFGNRASGQGGSISIETNSGTSTLENSTVDEGLDRDAAIAIATNSGSFAITHSTIVAGSALAVGTNDDASLTIDNTILVVLSEQAANEAVVVGSGSDAGVRYSAFSTTGAQDDIADVIGNQFSVDPLLQTLSDNGGPTLTKLPSAASPVIDAGDPAVTTSPEFDQRGSGFDRVVGGRVDIGAVEAVESGSADGGAELADTGSTVPWWAMAVGLAFVVLGLSAVVGTARPRTD